MNLDKLSNKHKLDKAVKNNYTYIEITHYDNNKFLRTETYPLTHFLEGFENEFKRLRHH